MLIGFFLNLRANRLPVSVKEYLEFLACISEIAPNFCSKDIFYAMARLSLVKDEKHYDRFDQAFGSYFDGLDAVNQQALESVLPDSWFLDALLNNLSEDEKAKLEALPDFEALIEAFKKRLEEQHEKHQGGSKWIGTGGTSPFGFGGYNPMGIRTGGPGRHQRATKVWEKRQFANLSDEITLGTRQFQLALRQLRKMARGTEGEQLDLHETIDATAKQAGLLDIKMQKERRNQIKVLLFLDVGGSMDPYIHLCEKLFSAARSEFKFLTHYYFHNCIYETLWCNNPRESAKVEGFYDILNTYSKDYKIIFVGDASMSPYEIISAGASVEHWNAEAGEVWLRRLLEHFNQVVWLNPIDEKHWKMTQSIEIIQKIMSNRMYPLTLSGLDRAIHALLTR
jgi:uncharacterized protein with von Willebrand factor type A (vWA) domain